MQNYWLSFETAQTQALYEMIDNRKPDFIDLQGTEHEKKEKGSCLFKVNQLSVEVSKRLLGCKKTYGSGTLILGDSHASDLFGTVVSRQKSKFIVGVTDGCRPHDKNSNCHYNKVQSFLADNIGVFNLVIYEQAGFYFFTRKKMALRGLGK